MAIVISGEGGLGHSFFDGIVEGLQEQSAFKVFQKKYWNDPAGFVRDCIYWNPEKPYDQPASYQLDILTRLYENKRESARGLHGLGKTAIASWAVHWFALTRWDTDWQIPTTASSWIQLTKYLWPEIHKWSKRLRWNVIGREKYKERTELLTNTLRSETGEAFAISHKDEGKLEGAHADHMFYVFDESKSLPDGIFDAAEGAMSTMVEGTGREVFALSISTPGEPRGRFYDIQSRKAGYEDWHVTHVTKEMAIAAKRVSPKWCEQRRLQWGENSVLYKNRVLGEFASQDESSVIPLVWVEMANERWEQWQDKGFKGKMTGVGVDVGGGLPTADKTTFAYAYDNVKVKKVEYLQTGDPSGWTMQIVSKVWGLLRAHQYACAYVDVVGVGAGVHDAIIAKGGISYPFVAQRKTSLLDRTGELGFADWRSAAWWMLREMLDPSSQIKFNVCLPPNDDLVGDLTAPNYTLVGDGRIKVESKKEIKGRLHRSTDYADSVIHVLCGPILWAAMEAEEVEEVRWNNYSPSFSMFGR